MRNQIVLGQDDIEKIKTYHLDVFIKLGFGKLKGEILKCARFGVWTYFHGNHETINNPNPGVWEFLEQSEVTETSLQILDEQESDNIILYTSYSSTDKYGVHRNLNNTLWKSLSFVPRKLEELYHLGPTAFFNKIESIKSIQPQHLNSKHKSPQNTELFKILLSKIWGKLKKRINGFFYFNQWIVLYSFIPEDQSSTSFEKFKRLLPPKDRFWADPFVVWKNDTYYIFLEELLYKNNKGTISVIEMDKNGDFGPPKLVMETEYHLSYPFIFEENGTYFMIPETKGNNTIELYQCEDFPLKWKLKKVLMENVRAVDATIFKKDQKYWMFVNLQENPGASTWDELFLFHSDSLLEGQWVPHALNPIVSDVRYSRPAGKIFNSEDKIYRPSQNCAKRYGYGMQLQEIVKLTENEYEERLVQSISPNWQNDLLATHTLNQSGGLTVIDAQIKRRR